jgi:hypothetical protein
MPGGAGAQSLLTNGDFEAGTVSGFSTTLALDATGTMSYGTYDFRTTAATAGTGWVPTADHTTGAGTKMYITRGANGNNTITPVWSVTLNSVVQNQTMSFSGYAARVSNLTPASRNPTFQLVSSDGTFTHTDTFASPGTAWTFFSTQFLYTGSSSALTFTLSIVNGSSGNGRDDAIVWDDFVLFPETSTMAAGISVAGMAGAAWYRARCRRPAPR